MTKTNWLCMAVICGLPLASIGQQSDKKPVDLPSSKQLLTPVPGAPARLNSLPMATAWSPDGRYLAILNAGYGTFESDYEQSIAILDTQTGKLIDYPDARTQASLPQTMYAGLAFSSDGSHLYASFDSLTAPQGDGVNKTGNAVAVYSFNGGVPAPERLIALPLQKLAPGKTQNNVGATTPAGSAIPAPAGLAVVSSKGSGEQLLIANEFSDNAVLLDAGTGSVIHSFDLSESNTIPAAFPIAATVTRDGRRGFIALWNSSAVVELDLRKGTIVRRLKLLPPARATSASSHPSAFAFSSDQKTLYVALSNRDAIAAIDLSGGTMRVAGTFDTRLPGQLYFGAMPDGVAVSEDGKRIYAANSGSDAIAVFDATAIRAKSLHPVKALGFVPTEWYPTEVAVHGDNLYIATAKGVGTGPNNGPQRQVAGQKERKAEHTYIATLLYGSLATVDRLEAEKNLVSLTAETLASNRMSSAAQHVTFNAGKNPIRHVIYIIKENRSYDQVFGDLGVGDGDPSLTMYGRAVTPNQHKLAEQFGVFDNFYDSGEVSGDGHVWSTAGITSDYTEKTWQQAYRGGQRHYDFEGLNEEGYPLTEGIPDVNEPDSGYLWTNLARHQKTLYHFGEYISTKFCDDSGEAPKTISPTEGTPEPAGQACPRSYIHKGEAIPANYGGGPSPYPWRIPLIQLNTATKLELQGHFDALYPDFNLSFPDQLRVEEFLTHFRVWVNARKSGKEEMPSFIMLRLADDHTAGTKPGMPRPKASVADNDLAVGRVVEAISHSDYWSDTAIFMLEDDAQDGADHVDAHRSIAFAISKYAPRQQSPFVDHHFYTTVSVIRTMEDLLGLSPMNNNDAFSSLMAPSFQGNGDQPVFQADYSNRDNGLIYEANTAATVGAKESSKMDFSHADQVDTQKLNIVLWRDAMGNKPLPEMMKKPHAHQKDADDD
jgi:DNA-binding beta-propeller fold protein YncE